MLCVLCGWPFNISTESCVLFAKILTRVNYGRKFITLYMMNSTLSTNLWNIAWAATASVVEVDLYQKMTIIGIDKSSESECCFREILIPLYGMYSNSTLFFSAEISRETSGHPQHSSAQCFALRRKLARLKREKSFSFLLAALVRARMFQKNIIIYS